MNTGANSPEAVQALSRQVLENLIDQQLAVDEAVEAKLHRSADVVAQIEASKREILARAYIQQLTASLPKPSEDLLKKYYADNPALFSERRVYSTQEILAKPAPETLELLRSMGAAGKPMEDIAAALKAKDIPYTGGSATRAAEQIPLDVLPRIHALKDGQSLAYSAPQGDTLLRVVSSQAAPVAMADALPRIEKFLTNQSTTEAVKSQLKTLRAKASISYQGEFAKTAPTAEANPAAPTAIEKGVAGLK
jgi:EpsD family peptidyl-prolyl cis-trans isomerase